MTNRCTRRNVLVGVATWLLAASAVAGPVLFVNANATGSNNGSSWSDAFTSLQPALAAAAASGGTVTEIWVAAGTYTPGSPGTRTATFQLRNGVAVYGGFAGGESLLSQRDPTANVTILSGDLNGDDGVVGNAENSYHVVTADYTDATARLDGFTITGGNANYGGIHKYGAGVLAQYGNPSISHCIIAGNVVNENNAYGGGVYAVGASLPLSLVGCVFRANSAKYPYNANCKGGGLFASKADLSDCQFIENQSDQGGGVYVSGAVSFTNCDFVDNDASYGAGVYRDSDQQVVFTGCTFAQNTAYVGGAIDFFNLAGSVAITNCLFRANHASFGGGINGLAKAMTLTNSVFIANSASSAGGGVATSSNAPHVTNCTFVGNATAGKGGGLSATASDSQPIITNCIFWQNSDPAGTSETGQLDRNSASAPLPIVNYCLVQGLSGALGGTANFDGDPIFVDADGADNVLGTADDDVRLLAGSPAIDAGDDAAVPPTVTTDFEGNPRIWCAHVDLGAFESASGSGGAELTCPPDVVIDCDESTDPGDPAVGTARAEDSCAGGSIPVTYTDRVAEGACAGESIITRTWTTTGGSGEPISCDQLITVVDTAAPVLNGVPADETVECDAIPQPAQVTASDNCSESVVELSASTEPGACAGESIITRTWTATDACGNQVAQSQIITVMDTTAPVLSGDPADITVECDAVPEPPVLTATDNCDADATVEFNQETVLGDCAGRYTLSRTWTATDDCGNVASVDQTVTVQDTTAPAITAPSDETVGCVGDVPPPDVAAVVAWDTCGAVTVEFVDEQDNGGSGCIEDPLEITRRYRATDGCENSATAVQVITVIDETAPVLTVPPDITLDCDIGADPSVAGVASATDACDADPTISYTETTAAGECPVGQVITRTWTATDACGNTASDIQVITLIDESPPSIECPPDIYEELGAGSCAASGLNLGSPVAGDTCTAVIVENDAPDEFLPGTTVVTWIVTDMCGHTATCEQNVTISNTQEPFLTCTVDEPMLWPPNHGMIDVGLNVTVDDDCDSGLAPTILVFADEDDEEDTGDGQHSPDALDIGSGTLRLRAERKGGSDGRVYLIVVQAEDTSGNVGTATSVVVVPHDRKKASIQAVMNQATAAQAFFQTYGTVPGNFVLVGDGAVLGPNQ